MSSSKSQKNLGGLFEAYRGSAAPIWHLDRPFDIAPKGGLTYPVSALADLVADMSGRLRAVGLRRGERLAIVKRNHFDVVLLAAAAARIGALPAMISASNAPAPLATMLARFEPKVLVASADVLAAAAAEEITLTPPETVVLAVDGDPAEFPGAQALADLAGADVPAMDLRSNDDPMICTHTSGTTGVPKLVVHSPNTLIGALTKMETMPLPGLAVRPSDTFASCIAYDHGRAITWTFAELARPPRNTVLLSESTPETVLATLEEHPPTVVEACPNIYQRWEPLLDSHPHLFRDARAYLNTFDAIHPRTVRKFLHTSTRRMPVWGQVWGQSETGPVAMALYTRGKLDRGAKAKHPVTSTVGRPIPFVTKVRLADPDTRRTVSAGQEGVVMVRTKGLCLSYLGEEDRYREKNWDGWWNSGDVGVRSRTGELRIVDREVDIIPGTSGIELESLLLERLEQATEVIVLGDPGGHPVPVISLSGPEPTEDEWRAATAGLPDLASPHYIPWEDFPRTGTWKVRRADLRERVLKSKATHGTGRFT